MSPCTSQPHGVSYGVYEEVFSADCALWRAPDSSKVTYFRVRFDDYSSGGILSQGTKTLWCQCTAFGIKTCSTLLWTTYSAVPCLPTRRGRMFIGFQKVRPHICISLQCGRYITGSPGLFTVRDDGSESSALCAQKAKRVWQFEKHALAAYKARYPCHNVCASGRVTITT